MRHTRGPWTIEINDNETWIESETQTIASQVSNCDASLIAAAPDMFNALEVLMHELTDGVRLNGSVDVTSLKHLATTVLKKAKGA